MTAVPAPGVDDVIDGPVAGQAPVASDDAAPIAMPQTWIGAATLMRLSSPPWLTDGPVDGQAPAASLLIAPIAMPQTWIGAWTSINPPAPPRAPVSVSSPGTGGVLDGAPPPVGRAGTPGSAGRPGVAG